jgi:hypothetical protein
VPGGEAVRAHYSVHLRRLSTRRQGSELNIDQLELDLSKAVELISSSLQIRGSAAYKILREAAEGAQLSVREMASVVVEAPAAPGQDMAWLKRERHSAPEVGKPRQSPS